MKKLILLCVLGVSIPASAEVISTVSFNPSRLGNYNYLKVANTATFKGGLVTGADGTTGTMNIQSGGTVTMNLENSSNYYNIPTVIGNSSDASKPSKVEMTGTTFMGGDASTISSLQQFYNAQSALVVPSDLLNLVEVNGGVLDFATSKDSYVGNINGATTYQHYTGALNPGQNAGTLNINGNSGANIGLSKKDSVAVNSDGSTRGFNLAGVDIPHPTGHMCEGASCGQTKPYQKLCWVPRCTTDAQVAWVLAVINDGKDCSSYTQPTSCGTGTGEGNGGGNTYGCKLIPNQKDYATQSACFADLKFISECKSLGYSAGKCLNGHETSPNLCWIEEATNCEDKNLTVLDCVSDTSCIVD